MMNAGPMLCVHERSNRKTLPTFWRDNPLWREGLGERTSSYIERISWRMKAVYAAAKQMAVRASRVTM